MHEPQPCTWRADKSVQSDRATTLIQRSQVATRVADRRPSPPWKQLRTAPGLDRWRPGVKQARSLGCRRDSLRDQLGWTAGQWIAVQVVSLRRGHSPKDTRFWESTFRGDRSTDMRRQTCIHLGTDHRKQPTNIGHWVGTALAGTKCTPHCPGRCHDSSVHNNRTDHRRVDKFPAQGMNRRIGLASK